MENFEATVVAKLDELRTALQGHGGDLELVAIEGKPVQLKLRGACGTCPHAAETLKSYIEAALRSEVDPEIEVVRAM
ncbi:MAG: NifU family protein [Lentisphaeria bacterium]|nr:NifU family protein [Lentisphaeria bacterium]